MSNDQNRSKRPRPPMPLESFGPNIMAALLKGAVEGFEVWASYKDAIRFRQRIHRLRSAMREAKHSEYPIVARVKVTIRWPEGTKLEKSGRYLVPTDRNTRVLLALRPNDSEFDDMLKNIGLDTTGEIESATQPEKLSSKDLDQLLDELMPRGEK